MIQDTNVIIREYLITDATLIALIDSASPRIYIPRLPENASLPAVSFFTRGGFSNPHIEKIVNPSVQIDCWADDPITARQIYRAVFNALQGLQNQLVTVSGSNYYIMSAIEEVQGIDLIDDITGYFRVMTFFNIMVRADT